MAIDPAKVCLFVPSQLKKFKLDLFERIGAKIRSAGGCIARHDVSIIDKLEDDIVPIVGCQPESTPLIAKWRKTTVASGYIGIAAMPGACSPLGCRAAITAVIIAGMSTVFSYSASETIPMIAGVACARMYCHGNAMAGTHSHRSTDAHLRAVSSLRKLDCRYD